MPKKQPTSQKFRDAFASAKKKGQKTFTYNGQRYSTQTASEKAKGMSDRKLSDAYEKAHSTAKQSVSKSKKKSYNEITNSYGDEMYNRQVKNFKRTNPKRKK